MNRQILVKLTMLACVCVGLGMAPTSRADHGTDVYLDPLEAEVNTRLEASSELTSKQKGALKASSNMLKRHSKNALGDAKQLAVVTKILAKAFPEDTSLGELEEGAIQSFLTDANTTLANLQGEAETLGDGMPAAFNKLLTQAAAEIEVASNTEDTGVNRTRALAKGVAKLTAASKLYLRTVRAPAAIGEGFGIVMNVRAGEYAALAVDGSYTSGEETGTWTYTRTGPKTGIITLTPTGEGTTPRDVSLKFGTTTSGAFNDSGVKGTFSIVEPAPVG